VRADEVAAVVQKSTSTAYYLLVSLCEEGFAVHEPGGLYRASASADSLAPDIDEDPGPSEAVSARAVEALFARTRKRSYFGMVRAGAIEIAVVRGRQGVALMPGLGTQIRGNAHALAMGKVVLARLSDVALKRYVGRGLPRYTDSTIVDPDALRVELDDVRRRGFAVDREEAQPDFCCVAAPAVDARGRMTGILGLSVTVRAFDREQAELAAAVQEIAGRAMARPLGDRPT